MIALASDHAGFELKEAIKKYLVDNNYDITDYGTNSTASVDYPVFGRMAAEAVASGECDRGIICCGTGIGISIVANKVKGIRCARMNSRRRCRESIMMRTCWLWAPESWIRKRLSKWWRSG